MNDVAVVKWRILPAEKPRVVLVYEERKVRTQFAPFVAEALGKGGVSADQTLEGLTDRPGVEGDVTSATGEAAVGAVQQHPHAGTTISRCDFRHPPSR